MIKTLLTVSLMTLTSLAAHSADLRFTAKGYPLGKTSGDTLFTYKSEAETVGEGRRDTNTYFDKDGKVLAVETMTFGPGDSFKSYEMDQKQIKAIGTVKVEGDKVLISYAKDGKSPETGEEKHEGELLVGPAVMPFLQRHWEGLMKGEHFKARFGVPDRKETVGFEYFKESDDEISGVKGVVIKMKPSSFLIAALVDPLHFHLTADGKQLRRLDGRAQVKKLDHGDYGDLDATTIYDYAPEAGAGNSK